MAPNVIKFLYQVIMNCRDEANRMSQSKTGENESDQIETLEATENG